MAGITDRCSGGGLGYSHVKKKQVEKWEMDKQWFISSPNNFFNIADVKYLIKKEETHIIVGFDGNGIDLDLETKKDREGILKFLKKCLTAFAKASMERSANQRNFQEAMLATQKRIIQTHIGVVK